MATTRLAPAGGDSYQSFLAQFQIGATVTQSVDMAGMGMFCLFIPTDFAGASLTIEATVDAGSNWYPINKTDGTAYTLTVAAGTFCTVPVADLPGLPVIRFVTDVAADTAIESLEVFSRKLG